MLKYLPWAGHRAFAYDYVRNERPSCIVELGSHYGCSAFAFLQAMKDGGIAGSFYAVDNWEGDSFTKNDYREDIYGQYKAIQDRCFSGQYSSADAAAHMLRMTFDEAVLLFEDGSIDLLHIDGSHRYEDVKHDFLTWKNKVRKDGVIFFHDTADEEVFGEVLGSHVFWKELVSKYPLTMEFPFSLGLGILCFDEEKYQKLRDNISADHYQMLENHAGDQNRDVIRQNFFKIRDLTEYRDSLISQVDLLKKEISRYGETVRGKEDYIAELRQDIKALNAALGEKEKYIGELQGDLEKFASTVSGKDAYIASLENRVKELEEAAAEYGKDAETQSAFRKELEAGLAGYREDAAVRDRYIRELEAGIAGFRADADKKENYIEELRGGIRGYQEDSALKDAYIEELLEGLRKYKEDTDAKELYIRELRRAIAEYDKNTALKDAYIAELLDRCGSLSKDADAAVLARDEAKREVLKYTEELSKSLFGRGLLKRMGKSDE